MLLDSNIKICLERSVGRVILDSSKSYGFIYECPPKVVSIGGNFFEQTFVIKFNKVMLDGLE